MFPSNPYNGQRHVEQNKEFMFNSEGWVPVKKQVSSDGASGPESDPVFTEWLTNKSKVATKAELLIENTWSSNNDIIYPFKGMIVSVWNDGDNNGLYMLENDNYQVESSWVKQNYKQDSGITPPITETITFTFGANTYTITDETADNVTVQSVVAGMIEYGALTEDKAIKITNVGPNAITIDGTTLAVGVTAFVMFDWDNSEWTISTVLDPVIPNYNDIAVKQYTSTALVYQRPGYYRIENHGMGGTTLGNLIFVNNPTSQGSIGVYQALENSGSDYFRAQKIATGTKINIVRVAAGAVYVSQYDGINITSLKFSEMSTKEYAESLVVNIWKDKGNWNPAENANQYPVATGIKKGWLWVISGLGIGISTTMGAVTVQDGDTVRALVDNPEQTDSNWTTLENNLGYTPENSSNKTDDVETHKASSIKFPSVKGIVDWITARFAKLVGGNNFADAQNFDGRINHKIGEKFYSAASKTADTINDTRWWNSAGVEIHQICTLGNATKEGGTWVETYRVNLAAFGRLQVRSIDTTFISGGDEAFIFRNRGDQTLGSIYTGLLQNSIGLGTGYNTIGRNGIYFRDLYDFCYIYNKNVLSALYFNGGDYSSLIGKYQFNAASPTADTVNDRKTSVSSTTGVKTEEICTVASATKGGGTWHITEEKKKIEYITVVESGGSYYPVHNTVNNMRAVKMLAGTHNLNFVAPNGIYCPNECYLTYVVGATVPTINRNLPEVTAQGTATFVSGNAVVTIAGTDATRFLKAGKIIRDSLNNAYTILTVDSATQVTLTTTAVTSLSNSTYKYVPIMLYSALPTLSANVSVEESYMWHWNGYGWMVMYNYKLYKL